MTPEIVRDYFLKAGASFRRSQLWREEHEDSAGHSSVPLLTDDSQIGANLRVCADEENRADFDQRG